MEINPVNSAADFPFYVSKENSKPSTDIEKQIGSATLKNFYDILTDCVLQEEDELQGKWNFTNIIFFTELDNMIGIK